MDAVPNWKKAHSILLPNFGMRAQDNFWARIQNGAIIYICGDAGKMAPDVEKAFIGLYRNKSGADEQGGAAWMKDLRSKQRYRIDVWPRN